MPAAPVHMHGDGLRLSQVFSNLLNNASKYSDPGSVIEMVARIDDGDIEVAVRDHGIGLGPDQARPIFGLFVQADNAIERASGGLGSGLNLVRQRIGNAYCRVRLCTKGEIKGGA